jgi:guanylate kinase
MPSGPVRSSTERRGILFIISAPSGTGKTTLCKQLVANIPGLWHSVSYTTRTPRPGEEHGREYYFTDDTTFQAMIDRHEFVEWARVYGHLYGTPRRMVADKIEQGIDVLLEIDVQGALQVKKKFDDAVSIFILPPSMTVLSGDCKKSRRKSGAIGSMPTLFATMISRARYKISKVFF